MAIAELMKLSNALTDARNDPDLSPRVFDEGLRALVLMLAPLAPHMSAELWDRICTAHQGVSADALPPSAAAGDVRVADVHGQVHAPWRCVGMRVGWWWALVFEPTQPSVVAAGHVVAWFMRGVGWVCVCVCSLDRRGRFTTPQP